MENEQLRDGPKGFTQTREVRALLSPYEKDPGVADTEDPCWGGVIRFEGLSWPDAEQLLKLLPEANDRDRWNASPTFAQFIDLGREFPEIRFNGYRVPAHRSDERITIEGYCHPAGPDADVLFQRVCELASEPDCYDQQFAGMRMSCAWWD